MCIQCQPYTRKDVDNIFAGYGIKDQDHFIMRFNNLCMSPDKALAFTVAALSHYIAGKQIGYVVSQFDISRIKKLISDLLSVAPFSRDMAYTLSRLLFNPDQLNNQDRQTRLENDLSNEYEQGYNPNQFLKIKHFVDFGQWINDDGKTVAEQIEFFLLDRLGFKFPENGSVQGMRYRDNFKSVFFNALKEFYLIGNQDFYLLIDKFFDWTAGEYGDLNSCIFTETGCNRHHLERIKTSCMALKIYRMEDGMPVQGIGRALLGLDLNRQKLILFNGYGVKPLCGTSKDNAIIDILSKVFAAHFNLETSKQYVESGIYINLENGYVFDHPGKETIRDSYRVFVFEKDGFFSCHACGGTIAVKDMHTHEGDNYCKKCYDRRFFTCECCGKMQDMDYRHNYYTLQNNSPLRHFVCKDCYRKMDKAKQLCQCESCYNTYTVESMTKITLRSREYTVCQYCARNR